jgi:hypothetical protein
LHLKTGQTELVIRIWIPDSDGQVTYMIRFSISDRSRFFVRMPVHLLSDRCDNFTIVGQPFNELMFSRDIITSFYLDPSFIIFRTIKQDPFLGLDTQQLASNLIADIGFTSCT